MGIFRTKEYEVSKISTSIFVLNFPDSFSSKDLFHACKQYGHVVDSFILSKRAKDGELWVLIEFESAKVKDLFKENGGANSWFSVLNQAFEDFTLGGRITWVEVEGIPFKLWSGHTFNRIASKWGKLMEVDDYDDTNFHSKKLCILTKEEDDVSVEDNHGGIHSDQEISNCIDVSDVEEVPETCFNVPEGQKGNPSEDPFGIYHLLNKDKNIREHEINEEESSLKYLLGFTPVGNLNEGHLDGGCAKKVNEEVAGDDNSFVHTVDGKENSGLVNKMSDSMGLCRLKKSGMPRIKLMIVVVYAPQEASEKRMLWDYLPHVSDQWDGEIVMMGDFNEVRYKSERFGSNFKAHAADIFNSFIYNAGLNEVHLGGSAFTWCHK
nr:nucleotide-binding alpha-beta plait domain-containing protein [Tanacetum cinerariifolium]